MSNGCGGSVRALPMTRLAEQGLEALNRNALTGCRRHAMKTGRCWFLDEAVLVNSGAPELANWQIVAVVKVAAIKGGLRILTVS